MFSTRSHRKRGTSSRTADATVSRPACCGRYADTLIANALRGAVLGTGPSPAVWKNIIKQIQAQQGR